MNPLDTNEPFSIELMNPNPTSSKTKDGPKYRVSFEMHKDDWQMFMDANTNGMVLEVQGRVTEQHQPETKPEKLKGGPLSIEAAQWCHGELQNEYALNVPGPNNSTMEYGSFKTMIYSVCGIESRAELDHSVNAAFKWGVLKNDFLTWSENRGET